MSRAAVALSFALALAAGCAPPTLTGLAASEQRALGETAVANVCDYELDVETPITSEHRYNLNLARQYLDDVVAPQVSDGQLSRFFTNETLLACVADLEWGGVNSDVQHLVERYGTATEKQQQQRRDCELYAGYRRAEPICEGMGFSSYPYQR